MLMKLVEIHFKAACFQRERLHIELLNDHKLLNILPGLLPAYEAKYPNIATSVLKDPLHPATTYNPQFKLFNAKTCKEYHLLFQHLLTQYQGALGQVASLAKKGEPFNSEVAFAVEITHVLLTMVKGRAFYLYLSTATPILSKYLAEVRQTVSDENNDDAEEELDLTLWDPPNADAMTNFMDSWQPFKSWIMLMLVQLDAADSLCGFVKKVGLSQVEIDVKLVYLPLISCETIPLEKLLQAGYIREPESAPITNAQLLTFIKASNVCKIQIQTLEGYKKISNWD